MGDAGRSSATNDAIVLIAGTNVRGVVVDEQTRCAHYQGPLDVIAIRFFCCGEWYPCHLCHHEVAGHDSRPWPRTRRDERAVLCGVCGGRLRISDYLLLDQCPSCDAGFNPGCRLHHHLYFV